MNLNHYELELLKAAIKNESELRKVMQNVKDSDDYIKSAYSLYKKGLIDTFPKNFVFGGDQDEPIDMVQFYSIQPTTSGMKLFIQYEMG